MRAAARFAPFCWAAMSDFQRPTEHRPCGLAADAHPSCGPISGRPIGRDLKLRVVFATVLLFLAKFATIAVPYTFKWATDALAGHGTGAGRAEQLARLGVRRPHRDDARLWRHAHRDGSADAMARRHFRQGGDERGAAAGDADLRARASALAALSSRAQDRRPDARLGARPQRHRDHRAHGAACRSRRPSSSWC